MKGLCDFFQIWYHILYKLSIIGWIISEIQEAEISIILVRINNTLVFRAFFLAAQHRLVSRYMLIIYDYIARLVNGSSRYEGLVELQYKGEWYTVCSNGWDLNAAHVLCNQLGLGNAVRYNDGSYSGQSRYSLWMNNLIC